MENPVLPHTHTIPENLEDIESELNQGKRQMRPVL